MGFVVCYVRQGVFGRTYACMYVYMNINLYVLINVCGSERWAATFAIHPRAGFLFSSYIKGGMPRPTRDSPRAYATLPEETATLTPIGSAGVKATSISLFKIYLEKYVYICYISVFFVLQTTLNTFKYNRTKRKATKTKCKHEKQNTELQTLPKIIKQEHLHTCNN
jgi:hypothetical protein